MTEPSPEPGDAGDRVLPWSPLAAWAASAALSGCSADGGEHEMRVGTEQTHRTIKVVVPAGDIAPWDLDTKHAVVGTDVSRVDGVAKVTGRAKYAYDMSLPGMLHAAMKRAPHASATVRAIDIRAARDMPGVRAVIVTKEPGKKIRFAGDDVAAVAADTLAQARDALETIVVDYDLHPHRTDYLATAESPRLSRAGAVEDAWPADARIDEALARAAHRVDATYTVQVQTHACLETHGLVADWRKEELEVWASTQGTFAARQGLAAALELPETRVRVHAEFVGGGFGSKYAAGNEGVAAALLSREAKAPVKLMLDRCEDHLAGGNRPAAVMQVRAGIDADGLVSVWDYRSWGGPGYTGRGGLTIAATQYLSRAAQRSSHRDIATDTGSSRAMRAPHWTQGSFASESMMDELARAAGTDPLELRIKNDASVLRREEWELGAERFGWKQRHNPQPGKPRDGADPRYLSGAGVASAMWGQMGAGQYRVTCRIHADGTVETRNGAQDIGTGTRTVMAILTAEELGIPVGNVHVALGDTSDPLGPVSGGSTTTPSLAPIVRHAAHRAKQQLAEIVAPHLEVDPQALVFAAGKVGDPNGKALAFADACRLIRPGPIEATGERYKNYGGFLDSVCGCQFAEVVVDTRTGLVRVTHMLAIQDCGLVIAKKLAESQVLGAMVQGLSYALHEQRIVDHGEGRVVNPDFLNYKISDASDMPVMDVVMVSVANGKNNVGAAGLGEPPRIATAGAIANAVANAIGARVRSLPITPDKVLAAWAGKS